jgi:hypothetical protein
VVGGIVVIALILGGIYFIYRQGKRKGLDEAARMQADHQRPAPPIPSGDLENTAVAVLPTVETEPPGSGLRYFDEERQGTYCASLPKVNWRDGTIGKERHRE